MRERPILSSGAMVRAFLNGTKTQTRRMMKAQPDGDTTVHVERFHQTIVDRHGDDQPGPEVFGAWWHDGECSIKSPYGEPGDQLWVREAWRTLDVHNHIPPREMNAAYRLWFEADATHQPGAGKYRPPMFMPRWASRITLEITGVRVERLQDINRGDAMAEGCPFPNMEKGADPTQWYADLWDSINGAGSWGANPWVWIVELKRLNGGEHADQA